MTDCECTEVTPEQAAITLARCERRVYRDLWHEACAEADKWRRAWLREADITDAAIEAHSAEENKRLREVLREAIEDLEHWADYVEPYFLHKYSFGETIAEYRRALEDAG